MSLFPAYAPDTDTARDEVECDGIQTERVEAGSASSGAAPALDEAALLASDSSDDEPAPAPSAPTPPQEPFYLDGKADNANLGVTTLYYPGRPVYKRATGQVLGTVDGEGRGARRRRRYYLQAGPGEGQEGEGREVEARSLALRRMLTASPQDEELWLRFIHFQEEWGGAAAWVAACEEATAVRGAGAGARLRAELHRARRATGTPQDLLEAITKDLHNDKCPSLRLEHWLRLLWTLSGAGAGEGGAAGEVQRAAVAALQDLPHEPRAYPHLLYVYGATLRAAGLWEQLVLLLELVCVMNYPPSPAFPPPHPDAQQLQAMEQRLLSAEDEVIGSGLPLSTVWVRVERLRSAAHWRPPAVLGAGAQGEGADPQRVPSAADVAPLLRAVRPAASLLLCASMLRLAQVPLLPASEATAAAWGGGGCGAEEPDGAGAALPALWRAARRLPRSHPLHPDPARAASLRRSLAALLDPPHCYTDEAGYLTWVSALWEACLGWTEGRRRAALACWRLRWLAALARLSATAEETRRLRTSARRLLRAHVSSEPLAFALFARIEADAGDLASARRIALQAVRASCEAGGAEALFAARVLREVVGASEPALCCAALCCAVLGHALPPEAALHCAPAPELLHLALRKCNERCAELERRFSHATEAEVEAEAEEEPDAALSRALTCGDGEWAAARVALLSPAARADELRALHADAGERGEGRSGRSLAALQYAESRAVALALSGGRLSRDARALRPLFPNNALLALACSGGGVWEATRAGAGAGAALSATGAMAQVLVPLLRAPLGAEAEAEAETGGGGRLARAAARAASRGAGGAALGAVRLEAEARRSARAAHRVLLALLHDHPNHKWLMVRGAAWVSAEAEALCDAALERGLRVHALMEELRPLPATPAPAAPPAPRATSDDQITGSCFDK